MLLILPVCLESRKVSEGHPGNQISKLKFNIEFLLAQ
jgi:hypothetical protein